MSQGHMTRQGRMESLGEDDLTPLPVIVSCFLEGVNRGTPVSGLSLASESQGGFGGLTLLPLFPAGLREAVKEVLHAPCDH